MDSHTKQGKMSTLSLSSFSVAYQHIYSILTGLVFSLSIMALPIGYGLTTTRVAILVLLFWFLPATLKKKKSIALHAFIPLLGCIIAFCASIISLLIHGGSILPVISWLPLGILGFLIANFSKGIRPHHSKTFILTFALVILILTLITMAEMRISGVLFSDEYQIRKWLSSNVGNDTNRYMNIMFINAALCTGGLYLKIADSVKSKIILAISLLFALYMIIVSGSRQNTFAFCFFYLVFVIISTKERSFVLSVFRIFRNMLAVLFITFAGVILSIQLKVITYEWISFRFLSFFTREHLSSSDESRLVAALNALDCSTQNLGFGTGPGSFPPPGTITGAHNGYLLFLAENGFILGGTALILIFIIILFTLAKCRIHKCTLSVAIWVIFYSIAIVLVNLKDLLREPIFWAIFGLSIGLSCSKEKRKFQIKHIE